MSIECCSCDRYLHSSYFSNNQWNKGEGAARCVDCVELQHHAPGPNLNNTRTCASCGMNYGFERFSRNQLLKGPGSSRCIDCVAENSWNEEHVREAGRSNDNSVAAVNMHVIRDSGTSRDVYYGTYHRGRRTGQRCVFKVYRNELDENQARLKCELDIKTAETAARIIQKFNDGGYLGHRVVKMNIPDLDCIADEFGLTEPFIENWCKFNSNTGWVSENTMFGDWAEVMQALSHFSYHCTRGQLVLCDLQGGPYVQGIQLTDPVILSRTTHRYGSTDLGPDGIENFFSTHRCTRYCSRNWQTPRSTRLLFAPRSGTTAVGVGVSPFFGRTNPYRHHELDTFEESDESDSDLYY